jgi:hypothetical protein
MSLIESLPTFAGSASLEDFRAAYDSVQCVCFKQVNSNSTGKKRKRSASSPEHLAFLKNINDTFNSATSKDQASWCIENEILSSSTLPSDFLSPSATQNGYCSFVLQDDSTKTISNFAENHVAHPTLPLTGEHISDSVLISSPYWLFVGRNNSTASMKGRSEHTDSVQHDGTFHYQVTGSKTWTIRPTEELRSKCDELDIALKDSYIHTVEEGDIFLMNTRLWWHQTEIPGAGGGQQSGLSISYARDIYLDGTQPEAGEDYMSSVEGAWATAHIPKGTILLTEGMDTSPLGRTKENANCEMLEIANSDEEGVQMALVTIKDINEGEFFKILESDSDCEEQ